VLERARVEARPVNWVSQVGFLSLIGRNVIVDLHHSTWTVRVLTEILARPEKQRRLPVPSNPLGVPNLAVHMYAKEKRLFAVSMLHLSRKPVFSDPTKTVVRRERRRRTFQNSGRKKRFSPQRYRAGLAGFSDWKSKKTPLQI
jgi:hypothetical protein